MTLAPNDFTHLHVHSEFSLLDGLGRIPDLVDAAAAQGFDSLALTDHGALYGAVAFYQAATAKGIRPILGVETYVARRSMTDKEGKADAQPHHLVLLARDWTGYQNLCRLITDAHVDGYYYKPRIDREHLARHSAGLIGLSACLGGEIAQGARGRGPGAGPQRLPASTRTSSGRTASTSSSRTTACPSSAASTGSSCELAPEIGLPLVVTNDLHYVRQAQAEAHDVLLCVGTGSNLDTPGRLRFETQEFYLKSAAEMAALFPDQREAILNTRADRRDVRRRRYRSTSRGSRTSRCPTARPSRAGSASECERGPGLALRRGDPGAPPAARLRARRHHLDGLRRLLPDRGRLRPLRP